MLAVPESNGNRVEPAASATTLATPSTSTTAFGGELLSTPPIPSSERQGTAGGRETQREQSGAEPKRRWSDELANGRWDVILTDAERTGIELTLSSATGEELFALANAARYRQRLQLAYDALLALRRRFGGSQRALDAMFLLGRVEEARAKGAQAISWYNEYLAQAPSGAYAAEALGRKLTLVDKALGAEQARPIAQDYLRRFPEGSYARLAQALLDDR
jgi:TolA-binding protein